MIEEILFQRRTQLYDTKLRSQIFQLGCFWMYERVKYIKNAKFVSVSKIEGTDLHPITTEGP